MRSRFAADAGHVGLAVNHCAYHGSGGELDEPSGGCTNCISSSNATLSARARRSMPIARSAGGACNRPLSRSRCGHCLWTRPIYGPASEPCETSGSSDWLQRPRLPYLVECANHLLAERPAPCRTSGLHDLLGGRNPPNSVVTPGVVSTNRYASSVIVMSA
jgi:hypothetical protein